MEIQRAARACVVGEWLLRGLAARVWEPLGSSSFHEYAERLSCWSPHHISERVRVARALTELPALRDALFQGRVNGSVTKEVTRNAGHHPNEDEVLQLMARAVLDGAAAGHKHSREGSKDDPNDDDPRARSGDSGRANYQIHLTVCETCAAGDLRGGGEEHRVRPEVVEAVQCDASVIEVPRGGSKPDMGPGSSSHVGRASQTIPAAVRPAVVQRDSGRCSVPGCRHHHFVDVHHIKLRSEWRPTARRCLRPGPGRQWRRWAITGAPSDVWSVSDSGRE